MEAFASASVASVLPPTLPSFVWPSPTLPSFAAPRGSSVTASGCTGVPPRAGVPAEDVTVETSKSVSNSEGSVSFSAVPVVVVVVLVEGLAEEVRESGARRRRELERAAPEALGVEDPLEPDGRLEE